MGEQKGSHLGLILILGLLSMLMPLAIDMYLPSLPVIAAQFGVSGGEVQMTLSAYTLGFAGGQLLYGPLADSVGRKPVILFGTLSFALAGAACALAQSIDQLIVLRLLHGLSAAAASVVINALMRDMFSKDEFSRMMSFVVLVMTVAPLLAPLLGGALMLWFSWHAIFWVMAVAALCATLLVARFIRETLPRERRQPFRLYTTLTNFATLFRHRRVLSYMLASAFSFSGMFSFFSAGPFVYIELHGVSPQYFGYYFALNIVFLFLMTTLNGRHVRRQGAQSMLRLGLAVQFMTGLWLLACVSLDWGFWALVLGVAAYVGCIAMVSSNARAVILDSFPHMAGTAASLAGTLRFGLSALVGALLAQLPITSAWPLVGSMALCSTSAMALFLYAARSALPAR